MFKISKTLIHDAQHAAAILGMPGFQLSNATADQLALFVMQAKRRVGGDKARTWDVRSRRVDLFADSVIANTLRWLIDLERRVSQRDFMRKWHEYSHANGKRKSENRSSFANNIGPYCRGAGHVLRVVHVAPTNPDGTAKMRTVYDRTFAWGPPGTEPIVRREKRQEPSRSIAHLEWSGPSIADWLAMRTHDEIDAAFQSLELRLVKITAIDKDPDERALTIRWLDRVRAEIARRSS